jgi:iron transport multicopper oxidase
MKWSDAGQRYSFVLTADQAVDNYWIRTVANGGTAGFDNGINSAILRYVGANDTDPTTNATTATAALVETDLHPLVATAVPGTAVAGGADVAINIVISLDFTSFTFEINGVVRWLPPGSGKLLMSLFVVVHEPHGPRAAPGISFFFFFFSIPYLISFP